VAERSKAALLKSAELQDSVGSNPTLSATDPQVGAITNPGGGTHTDPAE
jgi:hypothetical protein